MTIIKKAIFPREERSNLADIVDFFALCSVQLSHRGSQVEEMLVAHVVVASHKMYRYTSSIAAIGIGSPKGVLHCKRCRIHSIVCQVKRRRSQSVHFYAEQTDRIMVKCTAGCRWSFSVYFWLYLYFDCTVHLVVSCI